MSEARRPVASKRNLRVLHSYPQRLGKGRICTIAWHQIDSAAAAEAELRVLAGDCARRFDRTVLVETTLSRGRFRIPFRPLGTFRVCALHDWLVAQRLPSLVGKIDIIHAWPLAALRTIHAAKKLGIPVALERPNAHTRFAYRVVKEECKRIGVPMPSRHEHAQNENVTRHEELEYSLADGLLCPSEFVKRTFLDAGFPGDKLHLTQYGYDPGLFHPSPEPPKENQGLTVLFAGGCAPRKGLHFALEAWLQSTACHSGAFMIAGQFIPGYAEKLSAMLGHSSIKLLGYRNDMNAVMRSCDVMVLPSIEEGSALVTYEARGSGCVLAVSDSTGAICKHMENGLVHRAGDVSTLAGHFSLLHGDRGLLQRLRDASLKTTDQITWLAAGRKLLAAYQSILAAQSSSPKLKVPAQAAQAGVARQRL